MVASPAAMPVRPTVRARDSVSGMVDRIGVVDDSSSGGINYGLVF
jgi:hypothetical protein